MIACVSPAYSSANHTINTLRYSDRLKEKPKNQLNMKIEIRFYRILKLFFFVFICLCLSNCRLEENVKKFENFEKEFYQKIAESNAEKNSYQYDGLVPQNSYFIKSKLKYLKYTHTHIIPAKTLSII